MSANTTAGRNNETVPDESDSNEDRPDRTDGKVNRNGDAAWNLQFDVILPRWQRNGTDAEEEYAEMPFAYSSSPMDDRTSRATSIDPSAATTNAETSEQTQSIKLTVHKSWFSSRFPATHQHHQRHRHSRRYYNQLFRYRHGHHQYRHINSDNGNDNHIFDDEERPLSIPTVIHLGPDGEVIEGGGRDETPPLAWATAGLPDLLSPGTLARAPWLWVLVDPYSHNDDGDKNERPFSYLEVDDSNDTESGSEFGSGDDGDEKIQDEYDWDVPPPLPLSLPPPPPPHHHHHDHHCHQGYFCHYGSHDSYHGPGQQQGHRPRPNRLGIAAATMRPSLHSLSTPGSSVAGSRSADLRYNRLAALHDYHQQILLRRRRRWVDWSIVGAAFVSGAATASRFC
ncbi:hypothetical protein CHU98_g6754 [Xylaria longipes]|nr:hypothetical protein CHU98_g6754 [Xylaria longipes]